jgi:antitoxin Phd
LPDLTAFVKRRTWRTGRRARVTSGAEQHAWLCGLTFELKPTAEAGAVCRATENVHRTCCPAYSACRIGSALDEGLGSARNVRPPNSAILVRYLVMEVPVSAWPVQDAKARFSEFLDACIADGPQIVTKRGVEAAVLVPMDEWRRLQAAARPSLKELLLADTPRFEPLARTRGQSRRRRIEPIR